jgi:hypothetical protein
LPDFKTETKTEEIRTVEKEVRDPPLWHTGENK